MTQQPNTRSATSFAVQYHIPSLGVLHLTLPVPDPPPGTMRNSAEPGQEFYLGRAYAFSGHQHPGST